MAATFPLAFKNVLGSNWTRFRHRWPGRARVLRHELAGASVCCLVEVNRPVQRRTLAKMFPGWQVAQSKHGHNDIYSDPSVHELLTFSEHELGTLTQQQRYVTIARYRHVATGIEWTAATAHLSSSADTTAQLAAQSRSLQGRRLAQLCREHEVDVIAADLNNISARADSPRWWLEHEGFGDWRAVTHVDNMELNTHYTLGQPAARDGKHLDAIYVGPRVQISAARVEDRFPTSSDHFSLACTVSISADDGVIIQPPPAARA
jgi:hypothetical protein